MFEPLTPWLAELRRVGWDDREARNRARANVEGARRARLDKDAPLCLCGTKMRTFKEGTGFYCQHCLDYMGDLMTIVDGKPQRTGRRL